MFWGDSSWEKPAQAESNRFKDRSWCWEHVVANERRDECQCHGDTNYIGFQPPFCVCWK
ncbi:hypothetical protein FRB95_000396 [Tulasnella sp. JGI-2019a]|nr:hypothetical protein FRB95_000396 [Tulasnella sp. JGI-2019a]